MKSFADILYDSRIWAGSNLWRGLLPRRVRPRWAVVHLTENCQARCVTCDYWKEEREDHISADAAVHLLDRLSDIGVRNIHFSGGEPLLRGDLFEILKRVDLRRFRVVSVLTNGLLLKKLHKQINDSPITSLTVSIDALGEKNDLVRGVKGYFDLAMEGASLLRGKRIKISTSLTGIGADDLEGIADTLEKKGWGFVYNLLDRRISFFRGSTIESVWPDPAAVDTITRVLKAKFGRPDYELKYAREYLLRGAPEDGPQEPPCVRGFALMNIRSDGNVYSGCYVLPPMGNILETDIAQIVGSDDYRQRCLAMLRRECTGCTCGVSANLKMANGFRWLSNAANGLFLRPRLTGPSAGRLQETGKRSLS